MQNILSIDLESFVHMDVDSQGLSLEKKKLDNGHIVRATNSLLDILKKNNKKATFFVVAEVYDWYPKLIEDIRKRGHEIALHTYSHIRLLNKKIMANELEKSSKFIRHFKPKGFRAPQVCLTRDCFKVLKKFGFMYDSSSYDDFDNKKRIDGVLELPISVYNFRQQSFNDTFPKNLSLNLLKRGLPVGSGYFIAIFGKSVSFFIEKLNKKNQPYIMFMHPWQIEKPDIKISTYLKESIKNPLTLPYYFNRKEAFEYIIKKYEFTSFLDYIKNNNLIS